MANDGKRLLVDSGFDFVNSTVNTEIKKIPFFAQTTLNISGGTESDTSFSLDSLMKLRELAVDDVGDIKTLAFSSLFKCFFSSSCFGVIIRLKMSS